MRVNNKVIIVTGAGGGIGEGIAKRLAAEGAKVVVNDINRTTGEKVVGDITQAGGAAAFFAADEQLLQTVMLRSLKQAVYSPDNVGHFGLAYESYTHFTSPIRRYPDLLVHRAIKAVVNGDKYKPGKWAELGVHCSMTERRADDATRDVEAWLKCYYMQDKIGESFDGSVSGVTGFGIFVALDDVYIEGLVHVTDLGNDYFHFDAAKHQLLGERTGQRFRLGDRVRVKVVRVDLESAKIDFQFDQPETVVDEEGSKPARKRGGKAGGKHR